MTALANRQPLSPSNLDWLRDHIQSMDYRSPIFKLLKQELGARGWWKGLPRGKPDVSHFHGSARKASIE